MSADLPVDPAMVNARVTVTIETDATATSPATRTTVTMPHVTQVHATPVDREPVWDRDYGSMFASWSPGLDALVLRFDLPQGVDRPEDGVLYQVQMHTERMVVTAVGLPGRVAEPRGGIDDSHATAVCRHCEKRIVRPENGIWYHHDVAGPRVCE